MSRYFLELAYKGTAYSGFQSQKNANTIQAEIEKAFEILQKARVNMVGSSRTDTGVHAMQNFFHFDIEEELHPHFVYKMNAILPADIVVKNIFSVPGESHCRFDALSREYHYCIYRSKDPFLRERAYYFPYKINSENLKNAAQLIKTYSDFTSFSKRKTQVKTFTCRILESEWDCQDSILVYRVKANRFLRGMVRALVATMLQIGREKISLEQFKEIIESKDSSRALFGAPSHGLFLVKVEYPTELLSGKQS